jgi:hypothetical protein
MGSSSVKARNLAANPALLVHLESGDDVVILEGEAQWLTAVDPALWQRIADRYDAKYPGFRPDPPSAQGPFVALRPQTALGWLESDFVRSATRWRFGAMSAEPAVARRSHAIFLPRSQPHATRWRRHEEFAGRRQAKLLP